MRFLLVLCAIFATAASSPAKTESIVLGGGCFWCMQAAYKLLPGVTHTTCGYAGGTTSNPTYEEVYSETTGHAEVVKVDYNPDKISLEQVLAFFWQAHDPTQVGGQGADMGDSYRSIILYDSPEQKAVAEKSLAEAQKSLSAPITTQIVPLKKFWMADDDDQNYFEKYPDQAYCSHVIRPKVQKLKRELGQN